MYNAKIFKRWNVKKILTIKNKKRRIILHETQWDINHTVSNSENSLNYWFRINLIPVVVIGKIK